MQSLKIRTTAFKRECQRNLAGAVNVTYKRKFTKPYFSKKERYRKRKKNIVKGKACITKVTLVRSTSRTLHHKSDCQQPSPTGQHIQERWSICRARQYILMPSRKAPTSTDHRWRKPNIPLRSCPGTRHISLFARKPLVQQRFFRGILTNRLNFVHTVSTRRG